MLCFFFHDPATTEIYTLSLHDALPIYFAADCRLARREEPGDVRARRRVRLQIGRAHVCSSHMSISYAVFCLKKKTKPTDASGIVNCPWLAASTPTPP